ncbi:MAG: RNA 2'-phosphotransferase [Sneathiellales bacterium]|nr:RNA 2'-phosphotransferase [Sneathiellales bacterium]
MKTKLSKALSHALRHAPEEYGLILDGEGWAGLGQVVQAFQKQNGFQEVTEQDIRDIVDHSSKKRHEIRDGNIRAFYGHSLDEKIEKSPNANPPARLYHGTSPQTWPLIQDTGLKPMGRQYVHLSIGTEEANLVGRRKAQNPVILIIDTAKAQKSGTVFYEEKNGIWLSTDIPPNCVSIRETA